MCFVSSFNYKYIQFYNKTEEKFLDLTDIQRFEKVLLTVKKT